ncbi:MAG: T9SS type A sorting domain-containing protein [Gemmatimonadetes bacterium]|nr:T9SS type A sorting domain-containing protein [Gemmatimonadota bacterium]
MTQRILLLVLLGLLVSRQSAEALRFYVDNSIGDNRRSHIVAQNDTTPWRTVTHALKIAHLITDSRPHVIQLAQGTYSPASGETMPFEVTQTGIYFQTDGNTLFDAQGKSRIFTITAPTSDFVLRDVALLNGSADRGGAVYCTSCSLTVTDSRIIGNHASDAGEVIYVEDGRLQFYNNMLRFNGTAGADVPLLSLHNTFSDTSQREPVRNNTFYLNDAPAILTTGNRTDISSNIFMGKPGEKVPAIIDSVADDRPLVRYNLFWDVDVLQLSGERDSLKVERTLRDTITLTDLGIFLPAFVSNRPDTIAQVGVEYEYDIEVTGEKSEYSFNRVSLSDLPAGVDTVDWEAGILRWTPDSTDVGRHSMRVEMIHTPSGQLGFVTYVMEVFTTSDFPDTTRVWPIVNITFEADTSLALDTLNSILPSFSTAASAAGNIYQDPLFLNPEVSSFRLTAPSPARDAGNPIVLLEDAVVSGALPRNDIGFTGGPVNPGPPTPGTTSEVGATALPDSFVAEGGLWSYTPSVDQAKNILLIDPIPGHANPPGLVDTLRSPFNKVFPITWEPTLVDTGSWLIGLQIWNTDGSLARHYFPLRVRPTNEPPQITSAAPSQAFEDSAFTYSVEILELDDDPVSFALLSGPEGMTIDSVGVIRWTPTQSDTGSAAISLSVTDTGGESTTQSFALSVLNTNDAPVFTPVADTSATEDMVFTLQLAATDIDIADTTFVFMLKSGPDSLTIDSTGALTWMPVQADVGTNLVTVQVEDPQQGVDSTSFTISVIQVNDPPIISSVADTSAPEDADYAYTIVATDEEGETIAYELVTGPASMLIDSTGTISWTPVQADTGRHDVEIRISDPADNLVSQSFSVIVTPVNDAPILLSRAPADSFFSFEPGQAIIFSVTASDEEGDALSFRWLVDGVLQTDTDNDFLHVPDTTSSDTVVTRILDGTDSTVVQWVVDARAIPIALIEPDSIDFGTVLLGDSASATLTLTNPGRTTLLISNLRVDNLELTSVFSASQVLKDESQTLRVRYMAVARGPLATTIQFDTNDPDRSTFSIPVTGFGQIATQVAVDMDPAAGNQNATTGGGAAGDTLGVDFYVSGALDITQYAAEITYDAAVLSVVGFETTGADSNLLGEPTVTLTDTTGRVRVAVAADTISGTSGTGALGRLLLVINAGAQQDTQTLLQLDIVELLSEGFTAADTLRPETAVQIRIRSRLPADLTNNGIVDFDDFFLFADYFGKIEPLGDLNNSGGIVDFDDFFVFADSFGQTARLVASARDSGMPGLGLQVADRPTTTDQVEAQLTWSGDLDLRGLATWIEYDPRQLSYAGLKSSLGSSTAAPPALVWSRQLRPGVVQLAFGRGGSEAAYSTDWPILQFDRHDAGETQIRLLDGLGHGTSALIPLAAPATTTVAALPAEFLLYPAYPNPFNPETTIAFFVPVGRVGRQVTIRIYDLLGQPVRNLVNETRSAGHHAVTWHGRDDSGRAVAAGVYLIEMVTAETRIVHKALYLK